ncbi:hypothetical protein Y032_0015g2724 [Ancylostoma ceylanicum]|nr:hypothetical protein Y032_0015g2724 [Ancylostoma ceylanicum]
MPGAYPQVMAAWALNPKFLEPACVVLLSVSVVGTRSHGIFRASGLRQHCQAAKPDHENSASGPRHGCHPLYRRSLARHFCLSDLYSTHLGCARSCCLGNCPG